MQIKSVARYFWVFRIIDQKTKANKNRSQSIRKIDPGAVDFISGFSRENSIRWVNKLLLGNS